MLLSLTLWSKQSTTSAQIGHTVNLLKPSCKFTYQQLVFTLNLCVSYGSQKKQQPLPYTEVTDRFL